MADVQIKSASNGLYPHNYNPLSIASIDYGEAVVTRFIECEKSDQWKSVKANGSLRLAALDFPAYGRSYIKSAAFFVPYYQILQSYDGNRANMLVDKGQSCVTPHIKTDFLNNILLTNINNSYYATIVAQGTSPTGTPIDQFDCCSIADQGSDVTHYYYLRLNYRGKRLYKWFKMLGYDFCNFQNNSSYSANVAASVFNVNAYTILAYVKVYCDYFINMHMYNSDWKVQLLRAVKDGHDYIRSGVTYYDASTGLLSQNCISSLFVDTQLPFEGDMYTDAWNAENSPLGITNSASVNPQNLLSPWISRDTNPNTGSTPLFQNRIQNTAASVSLYDSASNSGYQALYNLSQLGLNSLGAVFGFVRRNNLFGSEAAKQAFARFGIKGDDYNTYFARKLYEDSQQIDFSAVMSNSNTTVQGSTDGSLLGAYAGVGLGSMNFDYNYQCSDYGLILNINWIQFNTLQIHGFDPAVLRYNAFDWFTPEYDGKAQRAIPMCEIGVCTKPLASNSDNADQNIYGFCGIYDEYRRMRDVVLGDFCVGFAKNFLFARDLSYLRFNSNTKVSPQTMSVQYYNRYGQDSELTDPFQFSNTDGDRFYLQFIWEISADRPILNMSNALMLNGEGQINESTSGNQNA